MIRTLAALVAATFVHASLAMSIKRVCFLGDSTIAGVGAGGKERTSGAFAQSLPSQVSRLLAARGIAVSTDSVFGYAGNTDNPDYDDRVTIGAWSTKAHTSGGPYFTTVTPGHPLTFRPMHAFDRLTIRSVPGIHNGQLAVRIDGETIGEIDDRRAATELSVSRFTVPKGRHVVSIEKTSGPDDQVFVGSIIASSETTTDLYNLGWAGATSAVWNDERNIYSPLRSFASLACQISIINLGINDQRHTIPIDQFAANMQAIIDVAKRSGDVILLAHQPTRLEPASGGDYYRTVLALAASNHLELIDFNRIFDGSFETLRADGFAADDIHPNAAGYRRMAEPIAKMLESKWR